MMEIPGASTVAQTAVFPSGVFAEMVSYKVCCESSANYHFMIRLFRMNVEIAASSLSSAGMEKLIPENSVILVSPMPIPRMRHVARIVPLSNVAMAFSMQANNVMTEIIATRSEEHTSELQSQFHLVCR